MYVIISLGVDFAKLSQEIESLIRDFSHNIITK